MLGGRSAEREVSLQSGAAVAAALNAQGIAAEMIDSRDEDWLERVSNDYRHSFIALHGGDGEDGTVQAVLKNIGVSYTGSDVAASALAMDKIRCKYLWQGMGLPTPTFATLTAESNFSDIIAQLGKVIVKPALEGSSIGMAIATTAEELAAAARVAREYGTQVLVEQWVAGPEFTVAILGREPLPVIGLETDHVFYDYDAKYIADDTRYLSPCGLDDKQERELQQLALAAFDSVGCHGWGRVDFMQDEKAGFQILEVNTVPGMTSHSLVPMAAKAAGFSFENLVAEILRLSIN